MLFYRISYAILSIIRAFIALQPLVIRHSALLLRTMASVAATIAVVRASATELGGSTAKKQKREKRPSENRPMAGQKGKVGERSAKVRNERKTDGWTARKRNNCRGKERVKEGKREKERDGGRRGWTLRTFRAAI